MAPTAGNWKLSDVSEQVLVMIMSNYKSMDAIMSKERISTGFGAAVDSILNKKKQINGDLIQEMKVSVDFYGMLRKDMSPFYGMVDRGAFINLIARMPNVCIS